MARQETAAELRDLLLSSGLFDGEWYRRRYGDVDPSGLDPLEHFLAFGMELGRDPGPDHDEMFLERATPGFSQQGRTALVERLRGRPPAPRAGRALQAAAALAEAGRYDDALRLGRQWLEPRDRGGLLILQANQALLEGNRAGWLAALNGYLADFGMAGIGLRPASHLLARLCAGPIAPVQDEVTVSVIMAAWNAEGTVGAAAGSILDQSWRNIELLVVDDASSDGTWSVLQDIAARDGRVRLMRNPRNVGPYVSKNLALRHARGAWVTGQDADDWSHPQRIERQVRAMQATGGAVKAGTGLMIRMTEAGHFGTISSKGPASPDGVMRNALISCMFDRDVLTGDLGNWDSVRFGADAEMMHRARHVLGDAYRDMAIFTMLCLDHPDSLTGVTGDGGAPGGMSPLRAAYLKAFQAWHAGEGRQKPGFHLPCPLHKRPFDVPSEMIVPVSDVEENFRVAPVEGNMQAMTVLSEGQQDRGTGLPEAEGLAAEDQGAGVPAVAETAAPVWSEEMLFRQNRLEQQLAAERSRADTQAEEVRRLTARLLAATDADRQAVQDKADLEARLRDAVADRAEARARMNAEIARLTRMILEEQEKAADLEQQLARRDREAQGMVADMAAREAARRRDSAEIAQLTRMVLEAQAAAERQAGQARERQAALERQVAQAKALLKQEQGRLRRMRERLGRMERSLSWRITRPLRHVRRLMGG